MGFWIRTSPTDEGSASLIGFCYIPEDATLLPDFLYQIGYEPIEESAAHALGFDPILMCAIREESEYEWQALNAMTLPLDVPCLQCGVQWGDYCRTGQGRPYIRKGKVAFHAARVRLADAQVKNNQAPAGQREGLPCPLFET